MPNKFTFEFAIIRVVPKVERGEFINVGVILFSKHKKYLGIKYKIDKKRLAAFSSEIDVALIEDYLKSWTLICEGEPHGGAIGKLELAYRFRWLTAARSTIIQSSQTHPGFSHDPKKELEDTFRRYVL